MLFKQETMLWNVHGIIAFALVVNCLAFELHVDINDKINKVTKHDVSSNKLILKKDNVIHSIEHNVGSKMAYEKCDDSEHCYQLPHLKTQFSSLDNGAFKVHHHLHDLRDTKEVKDCINFGKHYVFGGPELTTQLWPVNELTLTSFAMVPQEANSSAVLAPYWLSSSGFYVYVDPEVPLFVDQSKNDKGETILCLTAANKNPYAVRDHVIFSYHIYYETDAKTSHMHAVDHYLKHPTTRPNIDMMQQPIWSTWARFKADVDHTNVNQFATEINKFMQTSFLPKKNGQFEIDDAWETCYGSLEVDTKKFPDLKKTVTDLKALNFDRVTIWVHPFINKNCVLPYSEALGKDYLVKSITGDPSTQWWNSGKNEAGVIDFTNPQAKEWWKQRLQKLKAITGLTSFKCDAGETSWAPQPPSFNKAIPNVNLPNGFTQEYVKACAELENTATMEVRSAYGTQELGVLVRMIDKDTRWGLDNGLASLITTLLQMNLVGYSYVLPDMIGGNQYHSDKIDAELFVRWLQANVFMPSLQFSIVPWDFPDSTDIDVEKISKAMLKLRKELVNDYLVELIDTFTTTGEPINRPIWWLTPDDETALKINDEFMLGDKYLVAPVIQQGATTRSIYLPKGKWRDGNTGKELRGRTRFPYYDAPIDTLPYFIRIE